jgi:catechol 2,3-dioxygenase-like lactoylglutathione lyase family enzyme
MLPFTSVSHISVTVTNLDRAKHFYGSVVGLHEIPRPAFPFPGVWYGLQGALSLHVTVKGRDAAAARGSGSIRHARPSLRARGSGRRRDLRPAPRERRPFHDFSDTPSGLRQLFIRDPDGNMIELIGPHADSGPGCSGARGS